MVLSGDLSRTSITSARLTLRAFTAADAAESFAEADARIAKFMSWNPPASEKEFKPISQGLISDMKAGKGLSLVIRLTSTNEFIGRASLHPADATLLETGIWIKESAQGHGYGREAVAAVIKSLTQKPAWLNRGQQRTASKPTTAAQPSRREPLFMPQMYGPAALRN
jgi:RimJ/RimL family protein N-acetyltransferase